MLGIGEQLSLCVEQFREFCSMLCSGVLDQTILEENYVSFLEGEPSQLPRILFPPLPWLGAVGITTLGC